MAVGVFSHPVYEHVNPSIYLSKEIAKSVDTWSSHRSNIMLSSVESAFPLNLKKPENNLR